MPQYTPEQNRKELLTNTANAATSDTIETAQHTAAAADTTRPIPKPRPAHTLPQKPAASTDNDDLDLANYPVYATAAVASSSSTASTPETLAVPASASASGAPTAEDADSQFQEGNEIVDKLISELSAIPKGYQVSGIPRDVATLFKEGLTYEEIKATGPYKLASLARNMSAVKKLGLTKAEILGLNHDKFMAIANNISTIQKLGLIKLELLALDDEQINALSPLQSSDLTKAEIFEIGVSQMKVLAFYMPTFKAFGLKPAEFLNLTREEMEDLKQIKDENEYFQNHPATHGAGGGDYYTDCHPGDSDVWSTMGDCGN